MSGRVRVWCLRHAEAQNVTAGIAGAADDTRPLTARGRRQALAAARTLMGEPITRIYSSPALRARQTAALLAAALAVDVAALPELVEVGVGEQVLHAWVVEQDLGRRVPDGESGWQVVARVTTAFQRIAGAHPGEAVAVVGHVASLTVALGRLCALGAEIWGTPLPHARPFLVEWDGQTWQCPAWPGAVDAPHGTPALPQRSPSDPHVLTSTPTLGL
ncbi:MAG TPA: histidine phosphatase family protein [Chloroflexota bacterium]|nr:histidine phosphatase family protein [Chloroflexota bacterium]